MSTDEEIESPWVYRTAPPLKEKTSPPRSLMQKFGYKASSSTTMSSSVPAAASADLAAMAAKLQSGALLPAKAKPPAQSRPKVASPLELDLEDEDESHFSESSESDQSEEEDSSTSESEEEPELTDSAKRQKFMMNPAPASRPKRKIVMASSDEDEDEVNILSVDEDSEEEADSVGSVASRGRRKNHSDSSDSEDDERESSAVKIVMAKCESISENLRNVLASNGKGVGLLTEIGAQEMVANENLQLKPYQVAGVNWLAVLNHENINGVLADEMGLGKTVQAVAFLRLLFTRDNIRGPHLIVSPASTVENWHRELTTWLPELTVELYNGSQSERTDLRRRIRKEGMDSVDVWITTYTYFERESCKDDRQFLYSLPFHVCVYDEAHAIKNTESARYQFLMQLQSKRRLLLSGTPVQNKLDELFALLSFCLPSIFDPKKSKLRKKVFGSESDPERVRRILAPFILRRLKSQVLSQLSPKTEEVILLKMLPEQQTVYDKVVKDFAEFKAKSETERDGKRKANASSSATSESVFTELRKIANHPLMVRRRFGQDERSMKLVAAELHRLKYFGNQASLKMVEEEIASYSDWELNACCLNFPKSEVLQRMILPEEDMFEASAKAAKLRELIPELIANGHRILLFSQWTNLLDIFEEMMSQMEVPYMRLDGSTAVEERQNLVDEYNDGRAPVFLLSTRAGGLGINLTSADVVILHDLDFNPTIDSQAMDRCHRIGQKKNVRVIKLVCQGTVDEAIYTIQTRKSGLNKAVLGEDGQGSQVIVLDSSDSKPDTQDSAKARILLPSAKDFVEGVQQDEFKEDDKKEMIQIALKAAVATIN